MTCEEFQREIPFLASGESDGPEFEEHLKACAGCREDLEKARRMDGLLRETFEGLLPQAGFEGRTAIPDSSYPGLAAPGRPRPWILVALAAAALLFIGLSLVIAVGVWRRSLDSMAAKLDELRADLVEERLRGDLENERLVRRLTGEARRHVDARSPHQALAILDVLAEHSPSDEVLRLRARARLATEDFQGAIADATAIIDTGRAAAEDYLLRSIAYESAGRGELASADQAEALLLDAHILEGRAAEAFLPAMEAAAAEPAAEAAR